LLYLSVVALMIRYDNPAVMESALGRIFEVVKAVSVVCDIV
jgi:hypothetical protein